MPSIAAEDEIARDLQLALQRLHISADDFAVRGTEPRHFGLHSQIEIGVSPRLCGEEVEKVPLRHERDELGPRRQVREIGEGGLKPTETTAQAIRLGVRALQECVVEAE